jgi:ABC-type branched-subunit amino acid transport system ATPase component
MACKGRGCLADRCYVLGGGCVVAQGAAEALRDTKLDEAYLGIPLW